MKFLHKAIIYPSFAFALLSAPFLKAHAQQDSSKARIEMKLDGIQVRLHVKQAEIDSAYRILQSKFAHVGGAWIGTFNTVSRKITELSGTIAAPAITSKKQALSQLQSGLLEIEDTRTSWRRLMQAMYSDVPIVAQKITILHSELSRWPQNSDEYRQARHERDLFLLQLAETANSFKFYGQLLDGLLPQLNEMRKKAEAQ